MSDKVKIFYRNYIEDATLTASSEAGTLSKNNLKKYKLSKVWRTTGLVSQYVSADLTQAYGINMVAIWGHNLTTAATIRIRIGNDPTFVTNLYDTTHYAWQPIYGFDEGGFDEGGFDGVPILTDYNDLPSYTLVRLDASYNARYIRIDFTDAANTDGYIEAGYFACGYMGEMTYDISIPSELPSWVDPSIQHETEGSDLWVTKRSKYRIASYIFEFLDKAEALITWDDISRIVGGSRPIILLYFSDSVIYQYRYAMFGLITNANRGIIKRQLRQNTEANSFGVSIDVRELRK